MSRRWLLWVLVWSACLGYGTWLFAQKSQNTTPRREDSGASYSICKTNNGDILLDAFHGKTWMLRRIESGEATWLPIPRIDSGKDATQLWRKTSNFNTELGKNDRIVSMDKVVKEWGYVSIALDRLKAGYLGIEARIDGKKVYLMLDTGAPVTHLDLERTKLLQLKWKPWGDGENRGKLAVVGTNKFCEITKLEIGGHEIRRLIVGGHDESELNKVLQLYMDPSIDGELGSDVLTKLNAIIDYSSLKLYLPSPERKR